MRAAVFHQAGSPLTIEDVPDPRPSDDQVVIEVAYCGICGSDLHVTQYGFAHPGTILATNFQEPWWRSARPRTAAGRSGTA